MAPGSSKIEEKQVYQIKIRGQLKEKWVSWLDHWMVEIKEQGNDGNTTITASVPDQAALRGVLNKIWDLNLAVISVMQMGDKEG